MAEISVEIGKSYLYVQKDKRLWINFSDQLVKRFSISPSDILEFKPGSEQSDVGLLRKVLSDLNVRPHSSVCRLLTIHNAEILTKEQSNALLKTIEEPPPYCLVVIFTKNASRVLPTVKSRCIQINTPSAYVSGNEDLLRLLELDFSQFLAKIKNIESGKINDMLSLSLQQIKKGGLNSENSALYKKIAKVLIRISSTNASTSLSMEDLYVWVRARQEK